MRTYLNETKTQPTNRPTILFNRLKMYNFRSSPPRVCPKRALVHENRQHQSPQTLKSRKRPDMECVLIKRCRKPIVRILETFILSSEGSRVVIFIIALLGFEVMEW